MDQITALGAIIGTALGLITLAGVVIGWFRWGWPRLKARQERERSTDFVLLGRPAVPANPITGEPAQPAVPSIGQQMHDALQLIAEIHHETHHNDGSSIKDAVARLEQGLAHVNDRLTAGDAQFGRLEGALAEIRAQIAGELAKSSETLAHAAEASKTGAPGDRDRDPR